VHKNPFLVEGVKVQTFSLQEASARICDDVSAGKAFSVFTINLDHIVKLRRNRAFRAAYDRARIVLADGFPIVLSGRLQGRQVARTTGADLIVPLCTEASRRDLPVFLFGSTFETLTSTAMRLKQSHPDLTIAGVYAPEHGLDVLSDQANEGMEFIKNSGARICFVALGAPKQEIFSDRCASQMEGISFICIGAGLDFIAGHQRRAPKIFQTMGCEWLWRVLNDPRRLARRYLECLYVFPGVLLEGLARR
jgi:N-acetylglucosaminyldiphosphoundecaprenol N-acetyl-beta-D-mannosaminyltransferase